MGVRASTADKSAQMLRCLFTKELRLSTGPEEQLMDLSLTAFRVGSRIREHVTEHPPFPNSALEHAIRLGRDAPATRGH